MSILMTPPPSDDNPTPPVPRPTSSEDDISQPSDDMPGLVESGGAIGGMVTPQDRPAGLLTLDKTCEYLRGGLCVVHGTMGTKKFRGGHKIVIGRGGKKVKRYQRSNYYVCEPREGGVIQQRLSLVKMTPQEAGMRDAKNSANFSTSKEGQSEDCTELE